MRLMRRASERRTTRWGRSGRRRYGVIYRPSGRPTGRLDWVNDGGRDLPLTPSDLHVILRWAGSILIFAVAVAAIWTLLT
jgi:hypothetical protein